MSSALDKAPLVAGPEHEGMCFVQRLHPDSSYLNQAASLHIEGPLQPDLLQAAWRDVVRRHEALRYQFHSDGQALHIVQREEVHVPLVLEDAGHLSTSDALQARIRTLARRPFDPSAAPLIRAYLLQHSPERHTVVYITHHLITDRWSLGLVARDLMHWYRHYADGEPAPAPLTTTYGEYCAAQARAPAQALDDALARWRKILETDPPSGFLLRDGTKSAEPSFEADRRTLRLDEQELGALKSFARGQRMSVSMALVAGWAALIRRYVPSDSVCIGLPVAHRPNSALEHVVGLFMRTVPTHIRLTPGLSVRQAMKTVRSATLEANRLAAVPYPLLVEGLRQEGLLDEHPLFSTLLNVVAVPSRVRGAEDLQVVLRRPAPPQVEFPVVLEAEIVEQQLELRIDYQCQRIPPWFAVNLLKQLRKLLAEMAAHPDAALDELQLLLDEHRHRLLDTLNPRSAPYPRDQLIHQAFTAQARGAPDAIALICRERQVSYRELDEASDALARTLAAKGVRAGSPVALCVPRSVEFVLGALAILKAGAAYLPLDPNDPPARLRAVLDDAQPAVVLTSTPQHNLPSQTTDCTRLCLDDWDPAKDEATAAPPEVSASSPAYIIYTSGSTGRPKGVIIPHLGVQRLVHGLADLELERGLRTLFLAAPTFDASTFEIWAALLHGGTCVIYPEPRVELLRLQILIEDAEVECLWLTSTLFNTVVDERPQALQSLRYLLTGGEVLSMPHVLRALKALPNTALFNAYGPTESTTFASIARLRSEELEGQATVPIGRAISHTQVYLLDEMRNLVPYGAEGELYIGGDGLALGYLNDEERTAAQFVPNPFSDAPDARMYRTGDHARWSLDAPHLEFVGRIDSQIKIRGFRVEPQEIEARLCEYPGIAQAAVIAQGQGLQRILLAYVTASEPGALNTAGLEPYLRRSLPSYMVPTHFMVLPALPYTVNGKLDRSRLPSPETSTRARDHEPPQGATEQALSVVWSDLLRIPEPSRNDDFFSRGGHSLRALTLVARIADRWQCDLPLRTVFEAPILAQMARAIEELTARQGERTTPALTRAPKGFDPPLSFSQERIWFLERMEPGSALYTIPRALHVVGKIDVPRLTDALNAIIERHEALRTVCVANRDGERQRVLPARPVDLTIEDLSDLSSDEQAQALDALIVEGARYAFDLRSEQTLRVQLLHLSINSCVLQFVFHHGFADGWSLGIFWRELAQLYAEPSAALPALPLQYGDYAHWQRQWLDGDRLMAQLEVWQERFTPLPEPLLLPTDRPRREVIDTVGARRFGLIPQALVEQLEALAQSEGATLFMVLLSGLWVLLHRICEQDDVVVGSPVAGRRRSEFEGLIGFFVNNLAFRGDLSDAPSFASVLAQAKQRTLEAYENQDVPFEKLVEVLHPDRSLGTTPLYQVMLALLNTHDEGPELPGLRVRPRAVDKGTSLLDLSIFLEPCPKGLSIETEYRCAMFDAGTVDRWIQSYQEILRAACRAPLAPIHTLPLMGAVQKQQLLTWGRHPHEFEQTSLVQMMKLRLREDPGALAVCFGDVSLTRGALSRRVDALAVLLAANGLQPGGIVALHLERGLSSVIAILATVQAGGIYLPLEPQLPRQRRRFIMSDAAPSVMVTEHIPQDLDSGVAIVVVDSQGKSISGPAKTSAIPPAESTEVINLIYTSGSTGEPKGVLGAQASVLNRVQWAADAYPPQPGERWAHKTALAFVDAVLEVFAPIALGVPLVIIPQQAATDPRRLLKTIAEQGVTRLVVVPSMLEALLDEIERRGAKPSLHLWTSSGEPLSVGLVQRFSQVLPGQTLLNLYGSTETGADATAWPCDLDNIGARPPIGRPISNLEVQVRDPRGELVPIGVPGELFIGGRGLAVGYHQRPELNDKAFAAPGTTHGVRFFRTGDRARWRPDGQLEYWGRRDRQVKLRGVRIELGAVEAALLDCPGVREAAASIHGEGAHRRLVGYVCPPEALQGLQEALREHLPKLHSPSQFVGVQTMPRTATGKLNRDALLSPGLAEDHSTESTPKDEIEEQLLALWREVLQHDIGVEKDFFASGGHSLLAVRLFARIEDEFKVQLPLPLIFHAPSVRQLAEHLHQARAAAHPWDPLVPIQPAGTQPPLFLVHPAPGTVLCYGELARRLGPDQPVFGLQARGLNGVQRPTSSIEDMARDYLAALEPVQGHGPVRLGGWSMGGVIALEMARQLQAQGREVQLVLLFDTHAPSPSEVHALARRARRWVRRMRGRPDPVGWVEDLAPNLRAVARANLFAAGAYRATTFPMRVALVQAQASKQDARNQLKRWRKLAPNLVQRAVHGTHGTLLGPGHVEETARCVRDLLI